MVSGYERGRTKPSEREKVGRSIFEKKIIPTLKRSNEKREAEKREGLRD